MCPLTGDYSERSNASSEVRSSLNQTTRSNVCYKPCIPQYKQYKAYRTPPRMFYQSLKNHFRCTLYFQISEKGVAAEPAGVGVYKPKIEWNKKIELQIKSIFHCHSAALIVPPLILREKKYVGLESVSTATLYVCIHLKPPAQLVTTLCRLLLSLPENSMFTRGAR